MTYGVFIAGLGHHAPERIVPNSEIEARLGLEEGWIARRSGIRNRRFAAPEEALSDIALPAADRALKNSGIAAADIDLLLLATSTPDHLLPPSAPLLAHQLGLGGPGAVDITGACGGFLYALSFAQSHVRLHGKAAMVVAANILSRRINPDERASAVLFADAAGAIVLCPAKNGMAGLQGLELCSNGADYDHIRIPMGGTRLPYQANAAPAAMKMQINDGKRVFSHAVRMMTDSARTVLEGTGTAPGNISRFVPHQANRRMLDAVAHALNIPQHKIACSIEEFGNSSAATIPLTLSLSHAADPLRDGELLLFSAAGAGMTGGSALWRV
ncbi:beta-ketoacyl-ACP synthase III [Hoeflea prorocentri]|uniref:3-oxopimeloyl-[acyl-carrier-protein] synthase n=1 Tax=Hoeflea prorocentri TaxID=1922333 RepID=A0A9X3UKQ8_9HYPH|nr:beta-ketoacyl-ACP synthase III [Hoeflea prorocentri]MCY6382613.1 beta-ketoacyl-ACP synthase III [Hoeflea prorocentri]MDA5400413.1 beta-ketoacyl-ACP synthase III [Hoeflea prorocentri]